VESLKARFEEMWASLNRVLMDFAAASLLPPLLQEISEKRTREAQLDKGFPTPDQPEERVLAEPVREVRRRATLSRFNPRRKYRIHPILA